MSEGVGRGSSSANVPADQEGRGEICGRFVALVRQLEIEGHDTPAVLSAGVGAIIADVIRRDGQLTAAAWLISTAEKVANQADRCLGVGGHA